METRPRACGLGVLLSSLLLSACITPQPRQHDFGEVLVGLSTVSPSVEWTNNATNQVRVTGAQMSGGQGAFSVTSTPQQPFNLAGGAATGAYTFSFAPPSVGTFRGTASLQTTLNRDVTAVAMEGEGVAQIAHGDLSIGGNDLRPYRILDFERVTVGTRKELEFNIRNDGRTARTVAPVVLSRTATYSVVTPAGAQVVIQPGENIDVSVRFTPPAAQTYSDVVLFVDLNDPRHQTGTAVTGVGIEGE